MENTGNIDILPEHRDFRILYAQVIKSLILKIKNSVLFAMSYFFVRIWICPPSQFCKEHRQITEIGIATRKLAWSDKEKTGNLEITF